MKYKYNGQVYDVSIKALDSMPIGSIILFAGEEDSIPTGWMICDGRVVAKEGLEELYDVIGAIYGTPPSNSEFYLPDLRGRVPVGLDPTDRLEDFDTLGKTGGSRYLQAHEHNVRGVESNTYEAVFVSNNATNVMTGSGSGYGLKVSYAKAISTGSGDSGNLQPYLTLNYIIKAYNTTPTMASIVDDYSTSTQDGYSCNYANEHYGGTILYNNPSGTYGDITLSDNISNYSFIDVITINKDTTNETYGTYRFDTSLSTFRIMGTSISTSSFYILEKKYTKGTNILTASSGRIYHSASGAVSNYEPISIIKVIGYK